MAGGVLFDGEPAVGVHVTTAPGSSLVARRGVVATVARRRIVAAVAVVGRGIVTRAVI